MAGKAKADDHFVYLPRKKIGGAEYISLKDQGELSKELADDE